MIILKAYSKNNIWTGNVGCGNVEVNHAARAVNHHWRNSGCYVDGREMWVKLYIDQILRISLSQKMTEADQNCQQVSMSEPEPVEQFEGVAANNDRFLWGWLGFRPRFLQCLASPKWFLFFVSIFSLAQGKVCVMIASVPVPLCVA